MNEIPKLLTFIRLSLKIFVMSPIKSSKTSKVVQDALKNKNEVWNEAGIRFVRNALGDGKMTKIYSITQM